MGSLFGTDGIRGSASDLLTPTLAHDVGRALARACRDGELGAASPRPRVIVGRDTRLSGPALQEALIDGLARGGADALCAGVLPTPGVAFLTATHDADAGVVVSASHNRPSDNGIKVFGPGGWKVSSEAEDRIEALMSSPPSHDGTGGREDVVDALESYVDHLVSTVSNDLSGLRVAIDCANGAASWAAPMALSRLGVNVTSLHDEGDGARINDACGATFPEVIAGVCRRGGAIGLSFDGDADRVVLSDETGEIVDGDGTLALLAAQMRRDGGLANGALAVTVMSNQALRLWCDTEGIKVVSTPVGDRNVLEAMRAHGLVLGGEQAGHIVRLDHATTGDGILIGLSVLDIVARSGRRLADLVPFRPMPQVLVNVRAASAGPLDDAATVRGVVAEAEARLGSDGRVLVRPSGTEPVVRVMVEAPDRALAAELAELVAAAVRRDLNGDA